MDWTLMRSYPQEYSITHYVVSICPFVWVWYVVLKLSLVPKAACNSLQKDDVNKESLSKMILWGMPWSQMMSQKNTYATIIVVNVVQIDKKWANLVNLSTIMMMMSWQWDNIGWPIIKSMDIVSHFHLGISFGLRSPQGWWCSTFTL